MPSRSCDCGECRKCRYRVTDNKRNARPEVRERNRERARAYYAANPEKHRQRQIAYRNANLELVKERERARVLAPLPADRWNTYSKVKRALRDGILVRQPCEVCGAEKVEGHHEDYSKPLEVRWLCRDHHMELHRRVDDDR